MKKLNHKVVSEEKVWERAEYKGKDGGGGEERGDRGKNGEGGEEKGEGEREKKERKRKEKIGM